MSGRVSCIVLMLILPPPALAERIDPFNPVDATRCSLSAKGPQWQLKGVIGSGERWDGWLIRPETGWVRLKNGAAIAPGEWQVSHVDKSGARLVPAARAGGCEGQPEALWLPSPFTTRSAE